MKKRILGAILIILVSIPIIILGGNVFAIACGILGVLALLILIYSTWNEYNSFFGINDKAICFLLMSMFIPCIFYQEKNYSAHNAIYLSGCSLLLGMFFHSLIC